MGNAKASKRQESESEQGESEQTDETEAADEGASPREVASTKKKGRKPNIEELDRLGPPMSYPAALNRQAKHARHLDAMLEAGEKQHDTSFGELWPNACKWLRSPNSAVMTLAETHDSPERAKALGYPEQRALFGFNARYPAQATYNAADVTDNEGVHAHPKDSPGFRMRGIPGIYVVEPATKSREEIQRIVVHETQHDVDNPSADRLSRFASEFRAYWNDPGFRRTSTKKGSADNSYTATDGAALKGFHNYRQQMIFAQLYENPDLYGYARDMWASPTERRAILEMTEPEGLNLVVSPRIEELKTMIESKPLYEELKIALDALTKDDVVAMQSSGSRELWEQKFKELPPNFRTLVRNRIGNGEWPAD